MRRLCAVLLLLAAGCSGFAVPRPEQLDLLDLSPDPGPPAPSYARCRVHLSVDSPWLAGDFEGVVVARVGGGPVAVRAQFFGDLGPKVLDLSAGPARIVGYFPQTHEGVDCTLPGEASPHPLLFIGASLLEQFSSVPRSRVTGLREEPDGWRLQLKPVAEGLDCTRFLTRDRRWTQRRLTWMYGLTWTEDWTGPDSAVITAPRMTIRLTLHDRDNDPPRNPAVLSLRLPEDVRIVKGSKK